MSENNSQKNSRLFIDISDTKKVSANIKGEIKFTSSETFTTQINSGVSKVAVIDSLTNGYINIDRNKTGEVVTIKPEIFDDLDNSLGSPDGKKAIVGLSKYGIDINNQLFNVDINKFTGFDGYYTFNGDAPLFKSALEIYKEPNIKIEDSYLYYFYNYFQPKNYGELYNLNLSNSLYKISSFLQFKPWINSYIDKKIISKGLFGPCELIDIEHRLIRLKNLIKNIREFGYIPSEKDIVKGYILRSKDDFRFLITSGHHRIAVLKAINYFYPEKYNSVKVAFEEKRSSLKFVDEKDIEKWPAVSNNFCSKKDALEFFNKFFYF